MDSELIKFITKRNRQKKKMLVEERQHTQVEDPEDNFRVEVIVATADEMVNELQERTTGLHGVTSMIGCLSPHCIQVMDDDSIVKQA